MNPAILMAALQALQGGGQNIPPGQVMPSPPTQVEPPVTITAQGPPSQLPMTRPMGPSIAPGANPPPPGQLPAPGTQPPQQIGSPNPMAQQLLGQSIQTMNQPIPGYNAQQPSGLHGLAAILQAITGGLGQGLGGYGYGKMTGPQQVEQQQLEQQKAETMGRLAQALQQQQIMAEYYGQGRDIQRYKAETEAAKVPGYLENIESLTKHREAQDEFTKQRVDLASQLAQSTIATRKATVDQKAQALKQDLQKITDTYNLGVAKLGEQDVAHQLQAEMIGVRDRMVDVMDLARQQAGTDEGVKAQMTLAEIQNNNPIKTVLTSLGLGDLFPGISTAAGAVGQTSPRPGAAGPMPPGVAPTALPAAGPVTGATPTPVPAIGETLTPRAGGTGPAPAAKPTPQAKAGAKAGAKPAAGGGDRVRVKSPNGQTGSIPRSQLSQAQREGYTLIQ